jgi:hypothetical protein
MNDLSELENELRKLRPAQPSPVLFERVGEALQDRRTGALPAKPAPSPYNWWSLGFGLAAAAGFTLFALVTMERRQEHKEGIAQSSPASETQPAPIPTKRSASASKFVPVGGTNVVYNTRDEGLHFTDQSERPVRRVRYNTRQTWRWRNPETGASLRVSYPSEETVLIPVSGQ